MRQKITLIAIACIFVLLFSGVVNLVCIQGKRLRYLSEKNCVRLLPQMGSRGRILDRNGLVIAGNRLSYDVMVLPQEQQETEELLEKVSGVLGEGVGGLRKAFREQFVSSSIPVAVASNIDVKKAIALEELKDELSGVMIQPHPLRDYPYGRLACHVLGYLNEIDHWRLTKLADYGYKTKDLVGFGGIEEKYDYYLRQEEGGVSFEVDHRGRFVRVLGFRPPRDGKDIQLTLDVRVQEIAEEMLGGRIGSVILMDPYDGQIIAMVNSPGFDPEVFVKKGGSAPLRRILNDPDAPLLNRAISGVYPPASVFKVIVAAAGLENKKIGYSTTFPCGGGMQIGNRRFSCWDVHEPQNVFWALVHSCDVFFYRTGLLLGPEAIHDFALKFGLSKSTSIELPYEAAGNVPHPLKRKITQFRKWYDGDTANFSIGQGELLVTPLQIARVMAVFANGGKLVNPYVVSSIAGKQVSRARQKASPVPVQEEYLNHIRQALKAVVSSPAGTGTAVAGVEIPVAGKTGTAQVSRGQSHAWFAGFFPYTKPRFVICVFLENGGSGHFAAALARQIIEKMIAEGLV